MIEKPKRPKKIPNQDNKQPQTMQELIRRYDLDNTKIYDFLDELVGSLNKKDSYLTEEQVIGTWIDGKPLYEKTYSSTNVTVNLDAIPYDFLFIEEAIIELSTGATFTEGRYMGSTDYFSTYAYKNNNIVSIDLGSTWVLKKAIVRVRYTKTTD